MAAGKKYNVKLNSNNNLEALLQETYNLACQQYLQIQDEINKIAGTTKIKDLDIEGKERYGKIMANYIKLQQNSISQKYDIAKLMGELMKHDGKLKDVLDDKGAVPSSFNISQLREIANAATTKDESVTYDIDK